MLGLLESCRLRNGGTVKGPWDPDLARSGRDRGYCMGVGSADNRKIARIPTNLTVFRVCGGGNSRKRQISLLQGHPAVVAAARELRLHDPLALGPEHPVAALPAARAQHLDAVEQAIDVGAGVVDAERGPDRAGRGP